MRVLVLGTKGQLGSKVEALLREESRREVRGADLPELDITVPGQVEEAVGTFHPAWIVNCAAYTDVERAEVEPEKAYRVNSTAVRLLADAAARHSSRLLQVSTDYVFSGQFPEGRTRPYDEDDPPGPLCVYGASKLAGEIVLGGHQACSLVLRTSWLYGGPGRNFLDTMLRRGREAAGGGSPLRVVADQIGCPTDAWSLAEQVVHILDEGPTGLLHASCQGETSWYEFARAIFREARLNVPIEPIATADFPTKARRPAYSVLSKRRLSDLGLNVLPPWEEGLRKALRRRGGA